MIPSGRNNEAFWIAELAAEMEKCGSLPYGHGRAVLNIRDRLGRLPPQEWFNRAREIHEARKGAAA